MAEIRQKKKPLDTVKAVVNFEDQIKAKVAATKNRKQLWGARSRGLGQGLNRSVAGILPVGHVREPLVLIGNS